MTTSNGYVYLIGAGPGDPGLITIKGKECLTRADVVLYDYLANDRLLTYARKDAELIYSGKVGGAHNREQQQINELLVSKALSGKVVARLKGGDPFIFGRGGEECESLVAAGIPFEVVPGVTAAIGAAAYAGIPLTQRDLTTSVAFVTGHEHPSKETSEIDWERLSLGSGTVVFYMGVKNLTLITSNLIAHGRDPETPVALIRWGTRPDQEVLTGTLANIADQSKRCGFKAPAITIVGEVVRLRQALRWFDNRPLFGKGFLVTRAADQAGEFSYMLEALGATVWECPTIRIVPPVTTEPLDNAISELNSYSWVIFTSGNAVRFFFDRLQELGLDSRALGKCGVCAVGPKTAAALAPFGIKPDMVPQSYKAEGVIETFRLLDLKGKRILFPKADRARELIPVALAEFGAEVSDPIAYRNILPDTVDSTILHALEERRIQCVTFTSSSTVDNLAKLLGENRFLRLLEGVTVAAIGPVTAKTCSDLGLSVDIEPQEYTLAAMTNEIVSHFTSLKLKEEI